MKIQLESHDTTIIITKPYDDITINEWYDIFESCLLGITFRQEQINNYIIDKAEQLTENNE